MIRQGLIDGVLMLALALVVVALFAVNLAAQGLCR